MTISQWFTHFLCWLRIFPINGDHCLMSRSVEPPEKMYTCLICGREEEAEDEGEDDLDAEINAMTPDELTDAIKAMGGQ